MFSNALVVLLPGRVDARAGRRAPAGRVEERRREHQGNRAALARVAEDVSPSLRGGFRLFAW